MLKTVKATGKVVILSDLHLQHQQGFIFERRGFKSAEEHARFIREQWFELIDEETTVFNLGDSHFGDPEGKAFDDFTSWPCKIQYYLWGNHNSGSKQVYSRETRGMEIYPVRAGNVEFVGKDLTAYVNGKHFELSHFPKRIWDKMAHGAFALNGHSHGSDAGRNIGNESGKCLDIGVENALKYSGKFFFTFEEIMELLGGQSNKSLDHHN